MGAWRGGARECTLFICTFVFDPLIVKWSPQSPPISPASKAKFLHVIPIKVKKHSGFGNRTVKLGQLCSLSSSAMPERHPFPWGLHALAQCLLVLSITVFSSKTSIWTRWSMFLLIAGISCYLVCYTTTGDVTVDQGLGTAILIQLMVAADYILITDIQRDIYPKDQSQRVKGAEADISLMKRFRRALSLYTTPRGIGWSFEPRTLPKPSTKPRFAFVSSRIARALAGMLIRTFASVMVNSNPALSGNTLSVRDMGWFYHTAGVFAFALNAVAQINTVHCVLAAFCVGVGISGPQEWLNVFGSPFDAYTVQRFWGYVCLNPDVLDLTETLLSGERGTSYCVE
jgi:hypothetical protein